jgi:hypothetical protein
MDNVEIETMKIKKQESVEEIKTKSIQHLVESIQVGELTKLTQK